MKKETRKCFILDTNVLIHRAESIEEFGSNVVVITEPVLEELDHFKKGTNSNAYSARQAISLINKYLEQVSDRQRGAKKGVPLPDGGRLVQILNSSAPLCFNEDTPDNRILSIAANEKKKGGRRRIIVISKDINVRNKAFALGLEAQDYDKDKTSLFQEYGEIFPERNDYANGICSVRYQIEKDKIWRISGKDLMKEVKRNKGLFSLSPKNNEQECAIDALSSPEIEVIALTGIAGTGKTLLALAAGLFQVVKRDNLFDQVIVARPIVPLGKDLGYLPGDVDEKLSHWMKPVHDNLEVIVRGNPLEEVKRKFNGKSGEKESLTAKSIANSDLLQIEPLTYIRGRSLPKRFIIIDEAQNLGPKDVKTIMTRCGEGTKIVFTGDLEQIDNPYLDKESNGLAYLIARYINEPEFCYLRMTQSARSQTAEKAARLL